MYILAKNEGYLLYGTTKIFSRERTTAASSENCPVAFVCLHDEWISGTIIVFLELSTYLFSSPDKVDILLVLLNLF